MKERDSPSFMLQPSAEKNNVSRDDAYLPRIRKDREYTMVLDLDETLIHYEEKGDGGGQFFIRPYVNYFLEELSKHYEIVIFTASLKDYADYIIDQIDPKKYISHRLYRNHTTFFNNVYYKDLSLLGRDLAKTLIIDNNIDNFQLQPDNGIYIKSWYCDQEDRALVKLLPLLLELCSCEYSDVRVAMKEFKKMITKRNMENKTNALKQVINLSQKNQANSSESDLKPLNSERESSRGSLIRKIQPTVGLRGQYNNQENIENSSTFLKKEKRSNNGKMNKESSVMSKAGMWGNVQGLVTNSSLINNKYKYQPLMMQKKKPESISNVPVIEKMALIRERDTCRKYSAGPSAK